LSRPFRATPPLGHGPEHASAGPCYFEEWHVEDGMAKDKKTTGQANEGEGNRTAARQYNKAQQDFVKSADVAEKAHEAEEALEGREGEELKRAESEGKRHAHDEDPQVKR
jgi:hypothetical protein